MTQRTNITDDRRTADNKGFAIAGVPCFADTFVQGGSSVLRTKFSAKTPRHRKPPKRCAQVFYEDLDYLITVDNCDPELRTSDTWDRNC